jgi:hypothetical protein
MPIIFVHGVSVRNDDGWDELKDFLAQYVAKVISAKPDSVEITNVYWGDLGAAGSGVSIPRLGVLGMGAGAEPDEQFVLEQLNIAAANAPISNATATDGLIAAGGSAARTRMADLPEDQIRDVVFMAARLAVPERDKESARINAAAEVMLSDPAFMTELRAARNDQAAIDLMTTRITKAAQKLESDGLMAQGGGFGWVNDFGRRATEVFDRVRDLPGAAVGGAIAPVARKIMRERLLLFLGDVFVYLDAREGAAGQPGPIPAKIIAALRVAQQNAKASGEPIIVVTHSMGGQIIYDIITHFLPVYAPEVRIDFWAATASQVALFQEMNLFIEKALPKVNGKYKLPGLQHLGHWWNVWDANDVVSFTGIQLFEGLDEHRYDAGMLTVDAHGGYLKRPDFFRLLQKKVSNAKQNNWGHK